MSGDAWSGRRVTEARAIVATWLPIPCPRCPRPVDGSLPWVVGHKIPRWQRPDLMWDPTNWQAEHKACSDATGQAEVIAKAKHEALSGRLPHDLTTQQPPLPPVSRAEVAADPWDLRFELTWAHHVETAPEWLAPYLDVPGDASPALAMTAVHPEAVGSYGPQAIEWIRKRRGITLRWWQQLAMVRQLEHRADGSLCWSSVVETAPRRAGKSERLRSVALWRMEHGVELFEPDQVVVHLGRDLAIVREVQQRAWHWCETQEWQVTRGNGKEVVTHPNGSRWLAKASAYGFDVHLGLADECWDVDPGVISEDVEPATLDRQSPQVVLTSTSHRRATSLMKKRIAAALAANDGRTLLLLWGVPPGADIFDEETWRAASPYWTEERRDHIASKLLEAREAPVELDDPDPVGSWAHQYLNRWDLVVRRQAKGEPVIAAEAWANLVRDQESIRETPPAAAAIESWYDAGVSVVLAYRTDAEVVVSASAHDELAGAVAAVRASGFRGRTVLGASLMNDPAARGLAKRKGEGRTLAAVQELQRLLGEDVVRHDGGEHLAGQVLGLRTLPSADGRRMASTSRSDAVKAAVWAVGAARRGKSSIKGIVLASS